MNSNPPPESVDAYIQSFPADVQSKLQALRSAIKALAPDALETISYRMPAYQFHGPLIYFAAFPRHIGLYPAPSGIEAFQSDLAKYKNSKGAVQFPLDQPLPLELISRIVIYRVEENLRRSQSKRD